MSTPAPSSSSSGVDLLTLAITAIASATAAFVCSQLWARGTLASAALTPVLVALIKETLSRPAQVVSQAVPVRGTVRSASHPDEFEPVAERVAQQGEVRGSSRPRAARSWRMAIITGLLGFLVCAVIITVPELVSGKATSGGGGGTTLFGGEQRSPEPATPTDTTTTTPAETITVPPAETVTVPPASTTTVPPVEGTPELTTPEPPTTTGPDPAAPVPEPDVPLTPP